jgi:transmembrane sensor
MGETSDRSRALDEASRWFTELKRPSITSQALQEFREWRRDAANAAAFAQIERTWEEAGALRDRPSIRAATDAVLAARPCKSAHSVPSYRFAPLAVGFAAFAIVLGGGAIIANELLYPTYSTEVGGQRLQVLSDGSRVRLNTDSKIQVRYRGAERRITLVRGEGFFDVAHDAARPFFVEANGTEVRALGTKFNVRRDDSAVQVTLVEGRVQVRKDDQPTAATLIPNQTLTVNAAGISAARSVNAVQAAGWTSGRLTFQGLPLRAAIQEVNRYSAQKIVLTAADGLANEPVSGQFEPGDTATFLAAVEEVLDLHVTSKTDHEIRIAPGAPPG